MLPAPQSPILRLYVCTLRCNSTAKYKHSTRYIMPNITGRRADDMRDADKRPDDLHPCISRTNPSRTKGAKVERVVGGIRDRCPALPKGGTGRTGLCDG